MSTTHNYLMKERRKDGKRRKEEEEEEEEEEEGGELSPLIPGPGEEKKPRVGRLDWCHCRNCTRMSTEEESLCCHEDEEAWGRILEGVAGEERRPLNCIVEHPFFTSVCLNPYALRALHNRDSRLFDDDEEAPTHEKYRLTSFRAFVEFFHGVLEEDVMGPMPSCVAASIRGLFPPHAFLLRVPGYCDL
ncbi:uncharacterized protein LOC123503240 [Portunus trituberculatus]|uniref:uncharacterized protein LOC123503240 n=1 Tax=Portunus trituberculatus TaxID=210409 RepID=UPI001E1D0831|nr:uncharacterized protein LOC123503240 [Portunus trituberculatus]